MLRESSAPPWVSKGSGPELSASSILAFRCRRTEVRHRWSLHWSLEQFQKYSAVQQPWSSVIFINGESALCRVGETHRARIVGDFSFALLNERALRRSQWMRFNVFIVGRMSAPGSSASSPSQVMAAMFDSSFPSNASAVAGPEKRLEYDLRARRSDAIIDQTALCRIAATLPFPNPQCVTVDNSMHILSESGIIVYTALRVIITVDMAVELHSAIPTIVSVLADAGFEPEWAAFTRKNTVCPWEGKDSAIAHEYAVLKECFPGGSPFVFGPVDAHHYFYFVYDDLQRKPGLIEADVQINVKLYNCESEGPAKVGNGSLMLDGQGRNQAVSFDGNTYETLRSKSLPQGNMLSFETNAEALQALPLLASQLPSLKPDRFTIMMLMDPQSETGRAFAAQKSVGLEAEHFEGYSLANRMSNTFEHGYVVVKATFVKQ